MPIQGIRYKCVNCADYDLCSNCEAQRVHQRDHLFLKIYEPLPPPADSNARLTHSLLPVLYPQQQQPRPRPKPEIRYMTLMMFPSSGRRGFAPIQYPKDSPPIDRETLKKMLERENELRLTPAMQQKFDENHNDNQAFGKIMLSLQTQVLQEFGFPASDLPRLQGALSLYPDDLELRSIPYYSKYNRCRSGSLRIGDPLPKSLPLLTLDGSPIHLEDICEPSHITVLLAGSAT